MFHYILLGLFVLILTYVLAYFGIMGFVRFAIKLHYKEPYELRRPEFIKQIQMLALISKIPAINVVMAVALMVIWSLNILVSEVQTNHRILKELEAKAKT